MSGAHDRFFSDRSRVLSGRDHLSGPSQCVEDTWQKPARPAPAVALQFATACRFAAAVSAAIAQPTPGVPACGSMATAAHWFVNVPTKAQFDLAGGLASFEVWHLDKAWPFALSTVDPFQTNPKENPFCAPPGATPTASAPAASADPAYAACANSAATRQNCRFPNLVMKAPHF
jgi:hypothetical protein